MNNFEGRLVRDGGTIVETVKGEIQEFDTAAGTASSGHFFTSGREAVEVGEQFRLDCEGGQQWNIMIRRIEKTGEVHFEGTA